MTSTTLKAIALSLMFFDHVKTFISGTPIWLKWIGRISAPLFLFAMVWGLHYTRDRKKYLKNMYFWGVGMAAGDVLATLFIPHAYHYPTQNIFVSLFLVGFIVTLIEKFIKKEIKSGMILLSVLIAAQIAGSLLIPVIRSIAPDFPGYLLVIAIFPSLLYCEGTVSFILLGIGLYFGRDLPPLRFSLVYCVLSLLMTFTQDVSFTFQGLFIENYQWMMLAALPFMLLYNNKRGANLKWLFYVFYPAHIFLLCIAGSFIHF